MSSQKILFIVTEDWYFCSHRLPLAVKAKNDGYDVVVATRVSDQREIIEQNGLRLINLKRMKRSSINPLRELAAFIEVLQIVRRERPDLLHLVALKPAIYGALSSKLVGFPKRVNALGGLGFVFSSQKLLARFLRPLLLSLFRFIFNDRRSRLILQNDHDLALMTELAGVDRSNIRLILGAGVDLQQYSATKLPQGVPVVMLASRLLWDKGIGEFVAAASLLCSKGVQARFVLVGDPDPENPSSVPREQLQAWNDSGEIEWWGYRANMPDVLSQANVVCLPTYYGEGVPKILIEAMACARPIVTTDMPGCRSLVRGEKNGILVSPKSSEDLARAIGKLINSHQLCEEMGQAGRKIAETEYSLSQVVGETLSVYEELQRN